MHPPDTEVSRYGLSLYVYTPLKMRGLPALQSNTVWLRQEQMAEPFGREWSACNQ